MFDKGPFMGDKFTVTSSMYKDIPAITLENEADLQTESEGEGPKKSIVISLKK